MTECSIKRWATFTVVAILLSCVAQGCGGGSAPVMPGPGDEQDDGLPPPSDHNLFGFAGMRFDPDAKVYVIDRSPDVHYNLTSQLSVPLCPDCIEVDLIEIDEVNHVVKLLITLRNPTTATYYDVRGIAVTNEPYIKLVNPDGYITLFDDGGDIEWNPYYAYCLEKDDRSFAPGDITKRYWYIEYTPGESMDFTLVVEGSAPGHCEDVTRVLTETSDDTHLTPWEQTGKIDIFADDWQFDVEAVHLHIPALNIEVAAEEGEPNHFTVLWDDLGFPPAGEYEFYIEAWSPNPDLIAVRQYGTITVHPMDGFFDVSSVKGYPFRGITPMRNNRSPYVGPISLDNPTAIEALYTYDKGFDASEFWNTAKTLRVNENNSYYYGMYYGSQHWTYTTTDEERGWMLYLLSSGGDSVAHAYGGEHTILHDDRVTTYSSSYGSHWYDVTGDGQPPIGSSGSSKVLWSYALDLQEKVTYGGSVGSQYPGNPWQDPDFTDVYDSLPLSENHFLSLEYGPYAYPSGGRVAIRDAYSLEPTWADPVLLGQTPSPKGAAASPNGYIYYTYDDYTYNDYSLVCVNFALGQIWMVPINEATTPPAVADDGTIYMGTTSGVAAFNPDGTSLWSSPVLAASDLAIDWDGNPLVATEDKMLANLSGQTGEALWWAPIEFDEEVNGIIVDAEGKIYLGTDERLYVFNSLGTELDSYQKAGSETNPVLGADGTLARMYCSTYDCYAYHYLVLFD
jgi:hypothetical protein